MKSIAPDLTQLPMEYRVDIAKVGGWFDYRDLVILENAFKYKEIAAVQKRINGRRIKGRRKVSERWSKEDLLLLVELRKNKTFKEISSVLGRTRYSCMFMLNRLKRNESKERV